MKANVGKWWAILTLAALLGACQSAGTAASDADPTQTFDLEKLEGDAREAAEFAADAPADAVVVGRVEAGLYGIDAEDLPQVLLDRLDACKVDAQKAVETIYLAYSPDGAWRVDVTGALSVTALQCVTGFEVGQEGRVQGSNVYVRDIDGGVRAETAGIAQRPVGLPVMAQRAFAAVAEERAGLVGRWEHGGEANRVSMRVEEQNGAGEEGAASEPRFVFEFDIPDADYREQFAQGLAASMKVDRIFPDVDEVPVQRAGDMLRVAISERDVLAAFMRKTMLESFTIPSAGMVPTLEVGDHIFALKEPLAGELVERGQVVVYSLPTESARDFLAARDPDERACIHRDSLEQDPAPLMVHRIIALPGDEVEERDGALVINGEPLERETLREVETDNYLAPTAVVAREQNGDASYTIRSLPGMPSSFGPMTVPESHVLVAGDNRQASSDSRCWGPVPIDKIHGVATTVWYSMAPNGNIRWDRIGAPIE